MKVLLIEDEYDLRTVLAKDLSEEGHTIVTESNGTDGLLRALHYDYDLILLDVMLPEMDGWEILTQLRKKKTTPVLMLTARDSTKDRIRGLDLGSDDYVTKPFELDELKARMRALLRRGKGSNAPIVTINEHIEYDSNSRRVFRDGVDLELPSREINLLEIFVQRIGKVVSRETITQHLFSDCQEAESNIIDVYIYNLRTKLGRGVIKTRRGIGYELPKNS